jgi:putative SOS response-associated peptidase YedK
MCGRISLYSEPDYLARVFDAQLGLDIDPDARPSWNVPPTRSILAVADVPDAAAIVDGGGSPTSFHRELGRYRWGLVPSWAKDPSVGSRMFNARAETVATKPSFRSALAARRLVVVADGFYEWKSGTGSPKRPYYFTRVDGRPLALAGLWEQWWGGPGVCAGVDTDPPPLRTCTVITTSITACRWFWRTMFWTSGSTRQTGTSRRSSRCWRRRLAALLLADRSVGRLATFATMDPI